MTIKTKSLSFRLLLASGLVLTAFFALAAIVLEQGFQESAERSLKEKLQVQIYSLLSAAELSRTGILKMPAGLHEPRYASPGSGLYGAIRKADRRLIWRSPSAVGIELPAANAITPGVFEFSLDGSDRYLLHYAVIWENDRNDERHYVFTVAEDAQIVSSQVAGFKKTLRAWLLAIGLASLLIQFLVLRWSLKPLRVIGRDLTAIEQGKKTRLEGEYCSELAGLAGNLNGLISSERAHSERYRNTLADLAHSLKTPLAILRGCSKNDTLPAEMDQTLQTQITRMDEIVEYQLKRAAARGQKKLVGAVDIADIIDKIIASLKKVYSDKTVIIELNVIRPYWVYYEEGDLYEVAGNLLDNAFKWCRQRINIVLLDLKVGEYSFCLQVDDDGPGIPSDRIHEILKRGVRADQNIQGHGIGMAVVNDVVRLAGGQLQGQKSEVLGGMKWIVQWP